MRESQKKWYEKNKERILNESKKKNKENPQINRDKVKKWITENPEKKKLMDKKYRENNKEQVSENRKKYANENKESIADYKKEWVKKNEIRLKEKRKKYYNDNRELINQKMLNRTKSTPVLYLKSKLRKNLLKAFRSRGFEKKNSTTDILGCSFEDFKLHLESKFEPWMNWDNRGLYNSTPNYGWDIDHIIPVSSATTEEELIKLNHYTNLQPLCSYINRVVKKDNLDYLV